MIVEATNMDRFGNDEGGFSVEFDPVTAAVRVRGWGFWATDVAAAFGRAVRDACSHRPTGSALIMDMTQLKPMRDEGQQSFSMLMRALPTLRMSGATVMTTSQLTKLQLLRLVAEAGAKGYVEFT